MPPLGSAGPQRLVGATRDLRPRGSGAGRGGLSCGRAAAAAAGPGSGGPAPPGPRGDVSRGAAGRGPGGSTEAVSRRAAVSAPILRKPQAGELAADPGPGGGDAGLERDCDLRIPSGYLENL